MSGKYNYNIDRIKVVCMIMVVWIHVSSYIFHSNIATFSNYWIYRDTLNYAVPMFFAITGFLSYSMKTDERRMKKYIGNIFGDFVFASLFYIISNTVLYYIYGVNFDPLSRINFQRIIHGTWGEFHLWYLWAIFLTLLINFYIGKKISGLTKFIFSLILFAIFVHFPNGFTQKIVDSNGGFVVGLLYFNVGYLAHEYTDQYCIKISKPQMIVLLIVIFIVNYYIGSIMMNHHIVYFRILFVFGLLSFFSQYPGESSRFICWFKKYTGDVYIYHILVINFLKNVFGLMSVESHNYPFSLIFCLCLTIVLSLMCSYIISMIRNQIKLRVKS